MQLSDAKAGLERSKKQRSAVAVTSGLQTRCVLRKHVGLGPDAPPDDLGWRGMFQSAAEGHRAHSAEGFTRPPHSGHHIISRGFLSASRRASSGRTRRSSPLGRKRSKAAARTCGSPPLEVALPAPVHRLDTEVEVGKLAERRVGAPPLYKARKIRRQ